MEAASKLLAATQAAARHCPHWMSKSSDAGPCLGHQWKGSAEPNQPVTWGSQQPVLKCSRETNSGSKLQEQGRGGQRVCVTEERNRQREKEAGKLSFPGTSHPGLT